MIAAVGGWILRLTCAALLAAIAGQLMPEGPIRPVGRLVCALAMVTVLLRPLSASPDGRIRSFGGGDPGADRTRALLEDQQGQIMKGFIEQQIEAYILDKAAELGAACRVSVTCEETEEGLWLPATVRVSGSLPGRARQELADVIEAELAVPPDRQQYTGGG